MTAKPTADDVAKARELCDAHDHEWFPEHATLADALANARAEGRAEGIREAADVITPYVGPFGDEREAILALLDAPQGDDNE